MGELAILEDGIIHAAKNYLQATSLPPEALTSVIAMVRSYFGLEALIEYQLSLPPERQKNMVGTSPGYIVTDLRLKEIQDFVRMNRFPINCLYIAKDGSIAIRATGWRLKAQADPRIFKGWEDTPVEIIPLGNGNILFRKRVVAIFWTGERFSAEGAVDMEEMQGRREKTKAPPSFAFMISETRAKTRALRDAVGLPFEIAEDVVAAAVVEETTAIVPVTSAVVPVKSAKMGISEFLSKCKSLGLKVPDILARLGKKNLGEITSYEEALDKLGSGQAGPRDGAEATG